MSKLRSFRYCTHSDGVSNIRYWRTVPEAYECRDAGIHLFAVGVGLSHVDEVYAIASDPSEENTFLVDSFDELPNVTDHLVSVICEGNN